MTHTPGPWIITKAARHGHVHAIAEPQGHVFIQVGGRGPHEEQEANARLIAAAPALLEAAENLIIHARKHTDGTANMDAAWLDDLAAAVHQATWK